MTGKRQDKNTRNGKRTPPAFVFNLSRILPLLLSKRQFPWT
nr:MAG TPA: hypothetical protein [Caudoviricetes sp.]